MPSVTGKVTRLYSGWSGPSGSLGTWVTLDSTGTNIWYMAACAIPYTNMPTWLAESHRILRDMLIYYKAFGGNCTIYHDGTTTSPKPYPIGGTGAYNINGIEDGP